MNNVNIFERVSSFFSVMQKYYKKKNLQNTEKQY